MEKLTVLLFATQSLDEMEEAATTLQMGNGGVVDDEGGVIGDDDDDGESGGSGLGATDGTSAATAGLVAA